MVLTKHELPNGNVLIWLGKGGIWGKGEEEEGIDNILVLTGGDVLFLKTAKVLPLYDNRVKKDLLSLKYEDYKAKYDFPDNLDLWKELKEGLESGEYPPFLKGEKKQS